MKRESPEEQRKQMLEAPIPGLIGRLAVPTIISMLVTSIYNMADTYFVSHIGAGDGATSASGAVSIVFSLMAIIQAVGFTVGMGAGSFPKLKILYPNPRLRYFQNTLLCGYSESSASSWLPLDKESVSSICIATGRCFHTPAGC